jgi:hypothetical protein
VDLSQREKQFRALAKERRVPSPKLPDDPRMRIAALATLLRIDPMEALKSDRSVKALGAEARKRERASEKSERDLRKLLKSFDLDLEAGS